VPETNVLNSIQYCCTCNT